MTGARQTDSHSRIPVALDLSCLLDPPLTGVAYAALHQVEALHSLVKCFDLRLFGARSRTGPKSVPELAGAFSKECILSYVRRIKPLLWTRANFPPIEWFCGDVRLAHDFFHQLPAARNALRTVTIHDLSFIRHPEMHTPETVRQQTRFVCHAVKQADAIVAVSEFCKRELLELTSASEKKVHVVSNGVKLEEFAAPLSTPEIASVKKRYGIEGDHIIHLGTLEGRKNIPLLIASYTTIRNRRGKMPALVLAGKAGWKSGPIFAAIEKRGPGSGILQLGHVPRNDAIVLLRSALLCVYPSIYEGFGLPALEAMAAGVPLIVSDADALSEVAGDTATVFPRNDARALADALECALEDRVSALALAQRAQERASHMTWHGSALGLAGVWLKLLGEDPHTLLPAR